MTDATHRVMKSVTGYVYCTSDAGKRRLVNGFAFITPRREWLRMWATPSIESSLIFKKEWIVSHWESGARVTSVAETFRTPRAAMRNAVALTASLSDEKIHEALRRWYSGESWPGR